jgi:hypothetical protein
VLLARGDLQKWRENVLLESMKVVQDVGADFAHPTRTVHAVDRARA